MISTIIVALLLSCVASALSVQCEVPDMSVYAPQVVFTCTFSEAVRIYRPERIFVPNFVSMSPMDGVSEQFVITASVTDNTKGEMTLLLGEGAFVAGEVLSEEYSTTVSYDFIYENVNVVGAIDVLSDKPDFAMVRITGGQTVLQHVENINEIAVFPSCMTVLKVSSTIDAYEITVFVNDPSKINESTFRIKSGVIRSYWGLRMNVEKDVSFTVGSTLASTSSLALWPESNTLYTSTGEFTYNITALFDSECMVDETSFSTANVRVLSILDNLLTATLVNPSLPGSISFLGYLPNTCSFPNYPVEKTAMVVKVDVPTYTLTHSISSPGCSAIHVDFSGPVVATSDDLLSVVSENGLPFELQTMPHTLSYGEIIAMDAILCVSGDSDTFIVNVDPSVVALSGENLQDIDESVYISRVSMILTLDETTLPAATHNETYISREKTFQVTFNVLGSNPIGSCDFSNAFISDYLVEMIPDTINGLVTLTVTSNSIDHHVITFDASKVRCDGAFAVEFIPQEFKFAYDPAFLPGDIVITRVNSYYSPEFDFVPLRKVFTWNRVFFTDAGWVNEVYGFIDHGSDGYISWTPKTDVEAGTVQHWSYVAMTQSLDRSIPKEVETDYSFNYEMHGFLLDFQDNLFIYVTGNGDSASVYDDYNHITFIFGIYWSSSEWAQQTYDYMDITAEYSALPLQLAGYNIALGTQATPVPRGVNYMSIKQSNFNTFSNTYYHMIEKIVNKDNWVTSQKDRFNTAPLVSYIERPMDFAMTADVMNSYSSYCFQFETPFTVNYYTNKIALTFENSPLSWNMRYESGKYCIKFYRPSSQGIVKLAMQKGAFTYTTSSTLSPFTFESVAYEVSNMIYNTPSVSISRSSAPYQFIEVTSSIACASWNEPSFVNAEARLVSRSEMKSVYAVMFTGIFSMSLPTGTCLTEGSLASNYVSSYTTYYYPPEPIDALLEEVHFKFMKANTGDNTVYLTYPSGWSLDNSVVPTLGGHEATSVTIQSSARRAEIRFDESVTSGNLIIPSGLFYSGVQRSVGVHSLFFDFNNSSVDAISHIDMPWVSETITKESQHEAYFTVEFAPSVGSASPRELVFFENSCRTLGYIMGPSVATIVPIAIMHGECHYGVHADKMFDSYGNSNSGFEDTVSFDFLPPVGTLFLANDSELVPETTERYYWNFAPVIGVAFDEVVMDLEEEPYLLDVSNGDLVLESVVIENERTVIRYLLVNNTDGEVIVNRIEGIELRDQLNNTCISEDCILRNSLTFELDTVVPTLALSTETSIIYGDSIDIHYEVSEEMTEFTCSSIIIAISEVEVEVTETEGNNCHFQFTPKPLNGTYIVFSVPAGRFNDKALNGNAASNILTPMVFNAGATITVTAPEYTNTVQTEFSLAIEYSWLCPNYDLIFPSTFEYDRNIARIEKVGESVIVDGVVTQTFTITFFNFETYPEDRYKNMPIYIPSKVCSTSYGLYNDASSFVMSFDNTPTEPAFEMNTDAMSENLFLVKVDFEDMKEFGTESASSYLDIVYEDTKVDCYISRTVEKNIYSYIAQCPLTGTGNLNVTIHRGALIEMTGVPSASFSRILYVDANPPTITLSAVSENTHFGPAVTSLPIQMTVSEIMTSLSTSCFAFENAGSLAVSVTLNSSPVTSNQVVTLNMINTHLHAGRSGSFRMYVKSGCLRDIHNNRNLQSNKLTFTYDYTSPSATLTCPTENIVLNTVTFTGVTSEPIQDLTPENIQIPSSCAVREITMTSSTAFEVTVSCYDTGVFTYRVVNFKDLVGNIGSSDNSCATSFTIYGPTIQYSIQNLVKEEYVNTDRFVIELTAAPNCYSMNLTETSFVTENVKNIATTQLSACTWTLSGENIEEGLVVIRILEGAAVDVYGGPSLSRFIEFRSYQSRPTIISVTPTLVVANAENSIALCYDRAISRGAGNILTEGACNNAAITSVSEYCFNVNVAVTVGSRCYLYLEEDLFSTAWELSSAARYVFLEIDNQPPTIDVVMKVNGNEVASQVSTAAVSSETFYVNDNGVLEIRVPANVEMTLQKFVYSTAACVESIDVEEKENLEIAVAFKQVNSCKMTFSFASGFLVDAFGRSSAPFDVNVDLSKIAATATVGSAASATTPVSQTLSFSKDVTITEANVVSEVPFTVSKVSDNTYTILFTPEVEGEFVADFKDIKDVYGNVVSVQTVTYFYYNTQPTAETNEAVTVSTQTASAFELHYTFNHRMADLPTTLSDLYQCNTPLSNYFSLTSATMEDMTATIVLTPKAVDVEYKEFTCSLSSQGFVDLSGNTIAPTSFSLIIDNQPPRIESITHNGGYQFTALPVTITINFNKMVTLVENFASKVHGSIGEMELSFMQEQEATEGVNQIILVSQPVEYQPVAGDKLAVVVDAGLAVDANNLSTSGAESEFDVVSGAIELDSISSVEGEYAFNIIMTRPVYTVRLANIEAGSAVFESMSIEENVIHIQYSCTEQGPFTITFLAGAIVATDDSTNAMEIVFTGIYDTIAPSVVCTVPETVGASPVSIPCVFSKPVQTAATFFTVERGDIIVNTEEVVSEDGKTVTVTFTPIESVIPEYTDAIIISMNNCRDSNMNACLPVRYQTFIDFTRPVATIEVSRQYIMANETIDIQLTFSKAVVSEITQLDMAFVYPEDYALISIEAFEVIEAGLKYKWTVAFITDDLSNELIPFAIAFADSTAVDVNGNGNVEATATVYIHEVAPVIDFDVFSVDDENKQLTLNVTVLNGPVPAFTSSMFILSDNTELVDVTAVDVIDTTSFYHLTFQLSCTSTCEFSIRFLSEMIFNMAGHQLEHDLTFDTVYVMSPEVILHTENQYCSGSLCEFSVFTSEAVDIECPKIPLASEHFAIISGECYNTKHCDCGIEVLHTDVTSPIEIQVPAGLFKTAYNAENMESEILTIYYSGVAATPVFATEWTEEDPIRDIPFIVTPNTLDTILLPSMIKCFNCEVSGWQQLETSEIAMYSFNVTFSSETDNYIRVYMEADSFVDAFGFGNLPAEYILRRQSEVPVVTKFTYSSGRMSKVSMEFSRPVQACEGMIYLIPEDSSLGEEMIPSESAVFKDKTVSVTAYLLPNTKYTVSWDYAAICDETKQPASSECPTCTFTSDSTLPSPPLAVDVYNITNTNAVVEYSRVYTGAEPLRAIFVYTVPAINGKPFVYETEEEEGSFILEGLEGNTKYKLYVASYTTAGTSIPNFAYEFTTEPSTPKPVSHIRICSINNPTEVNGQITYSDATVCWDASPSKNIRYKVVITELINGNPGRTFTAYKGKQTSATFTVSNDIQRYKVTVVTISTLPVYEGEDRVRVHDFFDTTIDLENTEKYPQGAGITIAAERLSGNSVFISFNHPYENYFPIEKYLVQYGNTFDDTFEASGEELESYAFKMDKCLGNYVTVTVRAGVYGDFWGLPSNQVIVYCNTPRLLVNANAGYNFVTFTVTSDVDTKATCVLKGKYDAKTMETMEISVDANKPAVSYLFKSLNPDTDYKIECEGYDMDYSPVSGSTEFYTTANFELPVMEVGEVENIRTSYAAIPIASVNMPGTVYCVAKPIEEPIELSRMQFIKQGASAYMYPGIVEKDVIVSGLAPATEYHAKCFFDPDYSPSMVVRQRRLVDEEITFTTPFVAPTEWAHVYPAGSVVVPLYQPIILTAAIPITLHHGRVVVRCLTDSTLTQRINNFAGLIKVEGTVAKIYLKKALTPGYEYRVEVSMGLFLDEAGYPMPAITAQDNYVFIATSDERMISEPTVVQTVPAANSVSDLVAMKIYFTFDREIVIGSGVYTVKINDEAPIVMDASTLEINNSILTINNNLFLKPNSNVRIVLRKNAICSRFLVCNSERIILRFTVGTHAFNPSLISMFPANEQTDIPAGEDLKFVFNKEIVLTDDFVMTFTDENEKTVVLKYVDEKSKLIGNLSVKENQIVVKGSFLPAGHQYFVLISTEAILDKEGRVARSVPTSFTFTTSQYACGGNYIAEHMAEDCSCFLTDSKCECWCGESETREDVIIRKLL